MDNTSTSGVHVETQGSEEWLNEIKERFGTNNTRLNVSDEAFTVFLNTKQARTVNIIVGRYDRVTGQGIVMDKRKKRRYTEPQAQIKGVE